MSLKIGLNIIQRLSQINTDYIEIGYLKKDAVSNSFFINYDPNYVKKASRLAQGKSKLSVMIHPEDFWSNNWDPEIIKKISLVRICVDGKNIDKTKSIIAFFHGLGVEVSINLTHASRYTVNQCLKIAKIAISNGADLFYVADSNGNFLPEDVKKHVGTLVKIFNHKIKIGFHPHDNLGLAQINALTALESGAEMVDSSIMGFGKGAGNLRTEMFPMLLLRKKIISQKYDFRSLFNLARYFNQKVTKIINFEEQYKYSLYGLNNVGLKEDKEVVKLSLASNIAENKLAFIYANECGCDLAKLKRIIANKKINLLLNKW